MAQVPQGGGATTRDAVDAQGMDSLSPIGSGGLSALLPTLPAPTAPAASPATAPADQALFALADTYASFGTPGAYTQTSGTYSQLAPFTPPAGTGAPVADQVAMASLSAQDQLAASLFGPPSSNPLAGLNAAPSQAADPTAIFYSGSTSLNLLNTAGSAALSYLGVQTPPPASTLNTTA
jgi:hypothetical protein